MFETLQIRNSSQILNYNKQATSSKTGLQQPVNVTRNSTHNLGEYLVNGDSKWDVNTNVENSKRNKTTGETVSYV